MLSSIICILPSSSFTILGNILNLAIAIGYTFIKKVSDAPIHVTPLLVNDGVTIIVAVCKSKLSFMTVKDGILPLPLAANPILGLSFIQLNKVLFTVLIKLIGVVSRFAHNDWSETEATLGIGFTVIKKVSELPVQVNPLLVKEGVAMIVAI